MTNFKTFLKTDTAGYFLMFGATLIFGFIVHSIFFKKKNPTTSQTLITETNVTVKDTTFKGRGDVYTSYEKKIQKVDSDADFFKEKTAEMKEALNAIPTESKEAELQRKADSILKANQHKVNYSGYDQTKKTEDHNRGYAIASAPKIDKNKLRKEEIDNFQKESKNAFNEFFEGNGSKNARISSSHSSNAKNKQPSDALIYAVINGDQLIKNRDRVALKLTRDAVINGNIYRTNTAIYAIASFTKNRINLNITNINQNPVTLSVQDAMDGNKGIYIEGENLLAETANEAVEDGVRDFDIKGIPVGRTIKRMFTQKQREPKVQLLNNYKIILKAND